MNRYENVGFNPVDSRLSTFDPQRGFKVEPFEGTDNIPMDPLKGYKIGPCSIVDEPIIRKIEMKAREDEENFIFETVGPYCDEVAQRKISKKDLKDAVRFWMDNGCPRAW